MNYVKSILWDFGDGETSAEVEPSHTYIMPGVYSWSVMVTDIFDVAVTSTGTIYVYDYDYSTDKLHVAYTDKCYCFAMKDAQGVGGAQYTGTKWIWPTAYTGACVLSNNYGDRMSIVLDNTNGKFYQLGIKDQWIDRKSDPIGEYNISSEVKFKEFTAMAGEYEALEHIESHVHMRPYWETNRSLAGYDSNGFLTGYTLELQMFVNGEPTNYTARIQQVPRYGDYVYRKRIEDRRLQLKIITTASGWRMIKVQQEMMSIDKFASPDNDWPTEDQWQYEWREPVFWLTRDTLKPLLNRGTGIECTGTYNSLTTGPDGQSSSALVTTITDGILYSDMSYLTGDFTICFFIKDPSVFPTTVIKMQTSSGGTLVIQARLTGAVYNILFDDGISSLFAAVTTDFSTWKMITLVKSGNTLGIYSNGVITAPGFQALTLDQNYGGDIEIMNNFAGKVYNIIMVNRVVSASSIVYMYNDINTNSGDGGLLPILR